MQRLRADWRIEKKNCVATFAFVGVAASKAGGKRDVDAWRVHAGFVLVVAEDDLGDAMAY